jgi:peptide/nickel transport system permease protein
MMQEEKISLEKKNLRPAQGMFWPNIKRQLGRNRMAVWSVRIIAFLLGIALLADVLANERPLVCKYKGAVYFPVFHGYLEDLEISSRQSVFLKSEWKDLSYDWAIFPPVPYLPQNLDAANEHGQSPFARQHVASLHKRHWLGTDELGRDILAGLIYGTRTALSVGLISMAIALLIGLFFGSLAGFFGDDRLQMSRARLCMNLLLGFVGIFYAFAIRSYILQDALALSIPGFLFELLISICILGGFLLLANLLSPILKRIPGLSKKVRIPMDMLISRFIEILLSVPILFLIISVAAILSRPSLFTVMMIIGLTGWTGIARFIRAELLRIRSLEYMEAAKALGYSGFRLLFRHALPNAIAPALIALAFGMAGAILTESLLSFLGIGVPAESITWGSMLALAQQSPSSWWLALFPGFAIFLTVTAYNLAGEGLTDALDPRQKK